MWGAYPHSVIALASILIARFEILKIDQVQYRKKKPFQTPEKVRLLRTWNYNFKVYAMNVAIPPEEFWSQLEKCCVDIYMKIFDGASFPFWHEVGQFIDEKKFIIEEIDLNFMAAADSASAQNKNNYLAFQEQKFDSTLSKPKTSLRKDDSPFDTNQKYDSILSN